MTLSQLFAGARFGKLLIKSEFQEKDFLFHSFLEQRMSAAVFC